MADEAASARAYPRIDRVRAADQILEDLRERILSGELAHGSRFPADRDLAERYGVSVATVREAVRALAAMGLVKVRHGAGSIVSVRTETLIAMSMASAIQLEASPVTDVMDILGVVNSHAAGLAARHASDEEVASLRQAVDRLAERSDLEQTMRNLRVFLRRLSELCGNPLLGAICAFLGELQVELAVELAKRGEFPQLQEVATALQNDRVAVVEAIEARDPARAVRVTRAYHDHALELITSSPETQQVRVSDPSYSRLISSLMTSKLVSLNQ
jgi:GntR family transcriptional repressor for pyruvate dehydrogenase complex